MDKLKASEAEIHINFLLCKATDSGQVCLRTTNGKKYILEVGKKVEDVV